MERIKMPAKLRNIISVSDKRCEKIDPVTKQDCRRRLFIDGDKLYCFRCDDDTITREDLLVKQTSEDLIKNREINELLLAFKSDSLINRDLEGATFENYVPVTNEQKLALQEASMYVQGFDGKSGLLMVGKTGVGKSHLSVSISKEIIKKKHTCLFISIPQLMTKIRATYSKDSDTTETKILQTLKNVDLLIMDDLGAERAGSDDKGSEWARGKIFEIADSRAGKAIVVTSNYSPNELFKMYGERDFGRMVQYCKPIKVAGENYRFRNFK